ncbi:hypothetical protein [Aquisalimonas asiatica]|uniref:PqqD family protein, HPr-rel-A system n=1 Tax=Aquisalimonas asiatica TaxID=406100 RepID=A0A1H8U656_9GAMM|nr:hypothetical protein [Aquisalimonas asiatica]SEO98333.1 hypothetical protein SAMN04488052_105187 [Aquisalimonas asiatica]
MTDSAPAGTRRWTIAEGVEFRRCADDLLAFQSGSGNTHALGGISVPLCARLADAHGPLDLRELSAACSQVQAADTGSGVIAEATIEDALTDLTGIGVVREVRS